MPLRFIEDGPAPGAWNMAVDEALLESGRPTLRLYGWAPPCVSLGYGQDAARAVEPEALRLAGLGLVRRLTGGRAILHDRELTYALVLPADALPAAIGDSYRLINGGIAAALRDLGVPAATAPRQLDNPPTPNCFAVRAPHEVISSGRKIAGSAQKRSGGHVLQQGSILLAADCALMARVFRLDLEPAALAARIASLSAEGGGADPAPLAAALARRLGEALGLPVARGELTAAERRRAEALRRERYDSPDWTNNRQRLVP